MKLILVALAFLVAPVAYAYNPVFVDAPTPFEEIIIPMDSEAQKQSYLGSLDGYPDLYEFTLSEASTLNLVVRQRVIRDAVPVNLILLSVDLETDRIKEIIRLNEPLESRHKKFIGTLGLHVYESERLVIDLDPGLYRLEVSTPLNTSPYELDFGLGSTDNSYFGMFSTVWNVQKHFGYSPLQYLFSTYILYQIGIVILVGGIWYTWRKRKQITHAP